MTVICHVNIYIPVTFSVTRVTCEFWHSIYKFNVQFSRKSKPLNSSVAVHCFSLWYRIFLYSAVQNLPCIFCIYLIILSVVLSAYSLFETTQTLFWAVFGLIDLDNFELAGIKSFTRFWGMLMFGTYSVINIVVLLNLLIAMMNHSYQLISVSSVSLEKWHRFNFPFLVLVGVFWCTPACDDFCWFIHLCVLLNFITFINSVL